MDPLPASGPTFRYDGFERAKKLLRAGGERLRGNDYRFNSVKVLGLPVSPLETLFRYRVFLDIVCTVLLAFSHILMAFIRSILMTFADSHFRFATRLTCLYNARN